MLYPSISDIDACVHVSYALMVFRSRSRSRGRLVVFFFLHLRWCFILSMLCCSYYAWCIYGFCLKYFCTWMFWQDRDWKSWKYPLCNWPIYKSHRKGPWKTFLQGGEGCSFTTFEYLLQFLMALSTNLLCLLSDLFIYN